VNSGHTLFFRASASFSKDLKAKKYFNTVKSFWATLLFRAKILFKIWVLNNQWWAVRGGKEGSSSPTIIMQCAKRIRDPKYQIEYKFVFSCWKGTNRRATEGGGAFAPPEIFKAFHSDFDICRNFQRIKMKIFFLIIFKKSYWNFSVLLVNYLLTRILRQVIWSKIL